MKRTTVYHLQDATTGERVTFTTTVDVTPAEGRTVAELGDGMTIVERTPPKRGAWVAPYAANCAAHGWIASRATVEQATEEARRHHVPAVETTS